MILEALTATRDLGRLHEITMVLIRNGLGDLVRRLGIAPVLERAGRAINWRSIQELDRKPEVRLREALEELGPTFVKLGQILAGRADLLPPSWTEELSRLHSNVKPLSFDEIHEQLTKDLGAEPEEVFASFDRTPLAAASIAQVHRATLKSGALVVLKIRRPGIEEVVQADLGILARIAEQVEERLPELARYRPRALVREFSHSMREELDLRIEAKNAERMHANLEHEDRVIVPAVHLQLSGERLCVMDYLEGPSVGEWLEAGRLPAFDGPALAKLGAETILRMVFEDGCYHADPHPGNVLLLPSGRVGLIDCGLVGYLSKTRREEFLSLLVAVAQHDVELAVSTLTNWSDERVDPGPLAADCSAFIERYHGPALNELDASEMLTDLMALMRDNQLYLPDDVAMMIKVFLILDGMARKLDPEFVIAEHVDPFARKAWSELHSPAAILRRGAKEMKALMTELPSDVRQVASLARRGQLQLQIEVGELEQLAGRLTRSANRLTIGMVTAALIVGTSISLTISGGPQVMGMPLFGFLGFSTSMLLGFCLLWSIMRSGKN